MHFLQKKTTWCRKITVAYDNPNIQLRKERSHFAHLPIQTNSYQYINSTICISVSILQQILVVKTAGTYTPEKSALDSSVYTSHTKCCWVGDSSRNSALSWWLIFWWWYSSHKQKASFLQQNSVIDNQNPASNLYT